MRRRGAGVLQHHDAQAGTIWLCPAGIAEDMIRLDGEIRDSIHLYLPAQPFDQACQREFDFDPALLELRYEGGFHDGVIEAIARAVLGGLQDTEAMVRMRVESLSAALGVYLVHQFSNRAAADVVPRPTRGGLSGGRLTRVVDLMEARLDEDVSLVDLAREASLSPFHFARCFKASTGLSPHRFLLLRRLHRARAMLDGGAERLVDIAAACGFCSQAHFSQAFKHAMGASPGSFRAERRQHVGTPAPDDHADAPQPPAET